MLNLKKNIEEKKGFQIINTTKKDINNIKKIIQESFNLNNINNRNIH